MHKYRPRVHVFCIPKGHPAFIKKGQQQIFNKEIKSIEGLKRLANGPFDYKTFLFEVKEINTWTVESQQTYLGKTQIV